MKSNPNKMVEAAKHLRWILKEKEGGSINFNTKFMVKHPTMGWDMCCNSVVRNSKGEEVLQVNAGGARTDKGGVFVEVNFADLSEEDAERVYTKSLAVVGEPKRVDICSTPKDGEDDEIPLYMKRKVVEEALWLFRMRAPRSVDIAVQVKANVKDIETFFCLCDLIPNVLRAFGYEKDMDLVPEVRRLAIDWGLNTKEKYWWPRDYMDSRKLFLAELAGILRQKESASPGPSLRHGDLVRVRDDHWNEKLAGRRVEVTAVQRGGTVQCHVDDREYVNMWPKDLRFEERLCPFYPGDRAVFGLHSWARTQEFEVIGPEEEWGSSGIRTLVGGTDTVVKIPYQHLVHVEETKF